MCRCIIWSVTEGLGKAGGAALYNSDQPEQALANIATIQGDAIFLLKDFARYCDNDRISRRLRDLADGSARGGEPSYCWPRRFNCPRKWRRIPRHTSWGCRRRRNCCRG